MGDMVWKLKYSDNWFYLYILIEFQPTEVIDNKLPVSISAFFDITRSSDVKALRKARKKADKKELKKKNLK